MVYTRVFCRTNHFNSPKTAAAIALLLCVVCCFVLVNGELSVWSSYLPHRSALHNRPYSWAEYYATHPRSNRLARNLLLNSQQVSTSGLRIIGFRLEGDAKHILHNQGEYSIRANSEVQIRLFGLNIERQFFIGFSTSEPNDDRCVPSRKFRATRINNYTAVAKISLAADADDNPYIVCYSSDPNGTIFEYTDNETWFRIRSESPLVPMWVQIICILILLLMSGLFSGLNLGLMALDKNELQVIQRCGTDEEKYYAKAIAPVRKRGNYLLCTLLLGNVLVNSTLTIFLDDITSGVFAVILSTLSIVIFGEIIPQALCSRHGLAVGSKTIYITYLFMFLTFPLSYPISKLLDKILGEEIGSVYDRERLMEYIRITKDYNKLGVDEMNIISGALKFKKIRVAEVMTPIQDVFMLPYDTILDFDTMTLINNSGYSRIPIYENDRDHIVGIMHVKDLSLIDADHHLPIKVLLDFFHHPLVQAFEDDTLDMMLNIFKEGKSHMAFVRRVIDNGITDPFYEVIGVVTLEDVIEELIQAEINDETDVITDNRRKSKRNDVQSRSNYLDFIRSGFKQPDENQVKLRQSVTISPQLALAAFRFLASSVEPFCLNYISEEVLNMLMAKDIYFEAKGEKRKPNIREMAPENVLYMRDEPADYFIMILEGRARILVTKENQEYDVGPFYCFGISALLNSRSAQNLDVKLDLDQRSRSYSQVDDLESRPASLAQSPVNVPNEGSSSLAVNQNVVSPFVPDFTLFCIERTIYMRVTQQLYQTAMRTTVIGKQRTSSINKSLTTIPPAETPTVEMPAPPPPPPPPNVVLNMDRKKLPYQLSDTGKYRKISLSTNLPDSSLYAESEAQFDRKKSFLLESNLSIDNYSRKRKSSPLDSLLRRSDAVDEYRSNASNESLNSDPCKQVPNEKQQPCEKRSRRFYNDDSTDSRSSNRSIEDRASLEEKSNLL